MNMRLTIAFFCLVIISCNKSAEDGSAKADIDFRDSVIVGMTYDEVEKLLGKPIEIERGANQLKSDEPRTSSNPDLTYLKRMGELDLRIKVLRNGDYTYPQMITSVGTMLYVNWRYGQSEIDTIRYIQPIWKSRTVTLLPDVEYFINGKSVTKSDFELVKDTVYWGPVKMFIYSKHDWQAQKDLGLSVEPPMLAQKEIRKTPRSEKQSYVVPDTNYQAVYSRYSVLFDAASGRVASKGFMPYQVVKLQRPQANRSLN